MIPSRADGLVWLLLLLLPACHSTSAPAIAPGVYHHQLYLTQGPWAINILEIDLSEAREAGLDLRTARADLAHGNLEKTSALAANAVAAINGDFFYRDEPVLRTAGLQVRQGQLLQLPQKRSVFALNAQGRPSIEVFHFEAGLIRAPDQILPINALNRRPAANGLSLYTQFGPGYVDSSRAQIGYLLEPLGSRRLANDTVTARVAQVLPVNANLGLADGQWLVSAGVNYLNNTPLAPGDTVRLFCLLPPTLQPLREGIGGGPRLVRDGEVSIEFEQEGLGRKFVDERHPRTAIGYAENQEVLFLVTVDGRQPGYSEGMTLPELADFLCCKLAEYANSGANAYQALNLDGGGSTTMVIHQQVVNRPSDETGERPVANALLVVDTTAAL
ncbi:MAG: phosphodiester glycosidase family protein [Candidatus Latescibacteria bacterium]|nr:phosphodiester glycosidase family protein [Candidatus Latescibacterota bacterium]